MATVMSQTEEKWFSTMFQRIRSTRRKRRTTIKTGRHSTPVADVAVKSLVSVESDEVIPDALSEPEPHFVPGTQQAFTVAAKRKYELVDNFPTPQIQHPKEVMVRNHAVALNPIDWKSVDYNFCLPAFPWVTGRESAGVVVRVGSDVTDLRPGDRVWTSTYYKDVRAGCFQEYIVIPEHTVTPMPPNLGFKSASSLGVGALTAAMTLWKWMDVPMPSQIQGGAACTPQQSLLIWGGGAVTGQYATQLAAKAGLSVIVVGSARTSELLRKLGAAHVVTRDGKSDEEIIAEVQEIGQGNITRAIDLVGTKNVPNCLNCLANDRPAVLAPLAMMASDQEIPENVTVPNVEMKRFVLDEASKIYSMELNRLLMDDALQLPEMEVIEGGLSKVEAGLERIKGGEANGKKLVVSLQR